MLSYQRGGMAERGGGNAANRHETILMAGGRVCVFVCVLLWQSH